MASCRRTTARCWRSSWSSKHCRVTCAASRRGVGAEMGTRADAVTHGGAARFTSGSELAPERIQLGPGHEHVIGERHVRVDTEIVQFLHRRFAITAENRITPIPQPVAESGLAMP